MDYPDIDSDCFDLFQVDSVPKTVAGKQKLIIRE